jgi:hypothetical protein
MCIGRHLAMGLSSIQGSLLMVYMIDKLRGSRGKMKWAMGHLQECMGLESSLLRRVSREKERK